MFTALFWLFGVLAVFAIGAIGMLSGWAAREPLAALIVIPSPLIVGWCLLREAQQKREAANDAYLRGEHVPSMSPIEYEQFTARQLERAGWKVTHCGRTGDQGCDVLASLRGVKAVCQVKLYRSSRCGNKAVQEAIGARRHYGAQVMAVVAPSGFTRAAVELARSNGVHLLHHSALNTLEALARIP